MPNPARLTAQQRPCDVGRVNLMSHRRCSPRCRRKKEPSTRLCGMPPEQRADKSRGLAPAIRLRLESPQTSGFYQLCGVGSRQDSPTAGRPAVAIEQLCPRLRTLHGAHSGTSLRRGWRPGAPAVRAPPGALASRRPCVQPRQLVVPGVNLAALARYIGKEAGRELGAAPGRATSLISAVSPRRNRDVKNHTAGRSRP